MPVEWNGDEFMQGLREDASYALNNAAFAAESYAKTHMQLIPPRITRAGIFFGKKLKGGKEVYPGAPPGTFPGVREGNLRNSMAAGTSTPADLTASFGVYGGAQRPKHAAVVATGTKGYAGYLQFGTRNMKPRPWATLTLEQAPLAQAFQTAITAAYAKRVGGST